MRDTAISSTIRGLCHGNVSRLLLFLVHRVAVGFYTLDSHCRRRRRRHHRQPSSQIQTGLLWGSFGFSFSLLRDLPNVLNNENDSFVSFSINYVRVFHVCGLNHVCRSGGGGGIHQHYIRKKTQVDDFPHRSGWWKNKWAFLFTIPDDGRKRRKQQKNWQNRMRESQVRHEENRSRTRNIPVRLLTKLTDIKAQNFSDQNQLK